MSQELYPLAAAFGYTPHELSLNRQKRLSGAQWRKLTLRFLGVTLGGLLLALAPVIIAWGLLAVSTDQSLSQVIGDSRAWVAYVLAIALAGLYMASNYRALLLGVDILALQVRTIRGKGRLQGSYLVIGNYRFLLDETALQALQNDLVYRIFILPYSQTLLSIEYAE